MLQTYTTSRPLLLHDTNNRCQRWSTNSYSRDYEYCVGAINDLRLLSRQLVVALPRERGGARFGARPSHSCMRAIPACYTPRPAKYLALRVCTLISIWVGIGLRKIVACSQIYLAVPSCIYSFWHDVIPTSYFIFNDVYTCLTLHFIQ